MKYLTTAYNKLALRGRFRTGYVVYCDSFGGYWEFFGFFPDLASALHEASELNEGGVLEIGIIISKVKFASVKKPTIKKRFCQPRK